MDLGTTLAAFALRLVDGLAVVLVSAVCTVAVLLLLGWGVRRVWSALWSRIWR